MDDRASVYRPLTLAGLGACCRALMSRGAGGCEMGLAGAEAILRLRALTANGDFDDCWRYHLRREHERIHHARYRDSFVLAA